MSTQGELKTGLYGALKRALDRPAADRGVVVIALVLMAFSLDTGIAADDYIHKLIATGSEEIPAFHREDRLDLFHFTSGEHTDQLMRDGIVSWWVDPQARLAFYRPISSLTHYIDYTLWPEQPWAMHLHSLLWSALLLWGLLTLYRKLIPTPWIAALAMFLYALEDGRAWFVSWIAARNAVIATALSIWVLVLHHRARAEGVAWARYAAPPLMLAALLSGEGAIAICAYLFAYALFLDTGSFRARALSLAPHVAIVLAWRAVYKSMGYGAANSALYVDPLNVGAFLDAFSERAPILLFSQVGGTWSDGWSALFAFPTLHQMLVSMSVLFCGAIGYALWPLMRSEPIVRFGVLGALLSVVPASAAFSADRLLTWVAIGASIALARLISQYIEDREQLSRAPVRALILPPLMLWLVVMNVIVDPIFLPSRARGNLAMRDVLDRAHAQVPDDPSIRDKQIIYVNPAAVPLAAYIPVERAARGIPFAKDQLWLATSEVEVRVTREDERTLRVRPRGGFLQSITSHLLRDPRLPVARREVQLRGVRIEIVELTDDGRPAEILAHFERPLEDPKYVWLQWDEVGFGPFTPPAVGQQVTLPASDYLRVVFGDALPLPFDGRLPPPRDPHWSARQ